MTGTIITKSSLVFELLLEQIPLKDRVAVKLSRNSFLDQNSANFWQKKAWMIINLICVVKSITREN